MSRQHAKRWCFTINNPTRDDKEQISWLITDSDTVTLYVQEEEGEQEHTPHLQGFIKFSKQIRLNALKQLLTRAHLEVAKGTDRQNRIYCTKFNRRMDSRTMKENGVITKLHNFNQICQNIQEIDAMKEYIHREQRTREYAQQQLLTRATCNKLSRYLLMRGLIFEQLFCFEYEDDTPTRGVITQEQANTQLQELQQELFQ